MSDINIQSDNTDVDTPFEPKLTSSKTEKLSIKNKTDKLFSSLSNPHTVLLKNFSSIRTERRQLKKELRLKSKMLKNGKKQIK